MAAAEVAQAVAAEVAVAGTVPRPHLHHALVAGVAVAAAVVAAVDLGCRAVKTPTASWVLGAWG